VLLIIGVVLTRVTYFLSAGAHRLVTHFNHLDKNVIYWILFLNQITTLNYSFPEFYLVALTTGSRFKARVSSIPPPSLSSSPGASTLSPPITRIKNELNSVVSEPDTSINQDSMTGKTRSVEV
jgi:hypothetical protein